MSLSWTAVFDKGSVEKQNLIAYDQHSYEECYFSNIFIIMKF